MATLVFTCDNVFSDKIEYPSLKILHGDNVNVYAWKHLRYEDIFGKQCVDYREKDNNYPTIKIPGYSAIKEDNYPKELEIETWHYDIDDPDSEERYSSLFINYVKDPEKQRYIADMFGIPTFDELIAIAEKTNISTFVVNRFLDIYITKTSTNVIENWNMGDQVLTIGMPRPKIEKYNWVDRYNLIWKRKCKGDPTKYKKEFDIEVLYGFNGRHLVGYFGDISSAYPKDIYERYEKEEPIRYSDPYLTPEYVKEYRRKVAEEKIKRERQLELDKMTPGYCDICGSPHAEHIIDPYREINGWLCRSCYNSKYDDY